MPKGSHWTQWAQIGPKGSNCPMGQMNPMGSMAQRVQETQGAQRAQWAQRANGPGPGSRIPTVLHCFCGPPNNHPGVLQMGKSRRRRKGRCCQTQMLVLVGVSTTLVNLVIMYKYGPGRPCPFLRQGSTTSVIGPLKVHPAPTY